MVPSGRQLPPDPAAQLTECAKDRDRDGAITGDTARRQPSDEDGAVPDGMAMRKVSGWCGLSWGTLGSAEGSRLGALWGSVQGAAVLGHSGGLSGGQLSWGTLGSVRGAAVLGHSGGLCRGQLSWGTLGVCAGGSCLEALWGSVQGAAVLGNSGGLILYLQAVVSADTAVVGWTGIPGNRRISEMPLQGLNRMRISGALNKLAGYECRSEDLEFLRHIENQEKARALKDAVSEDAAVLIQPEIQDKRRISQLPVQGLNRMRISGALKKLAGYECRSEDLEFLRHIENQEKARALKEELLCLRKALAATDQEKELLLGRKEKVEEDIEKMKVSLDRTVLLGRGLLSRKQDSGNVGNLSPDEVLKKLKAMTVQCVLQQTRQQLVAAAKELTRRRQEVSDRASHAENRKRSLTLQVASCEQEVGEVQSRVQQVQGEAIALRTQVEQTEKEKSELEALVHKKRLQLVYCTNPAEQKTEPGEEQRQKVQRKLQRILHRKDNYLERERILQKLKAELL
ncbi:hypothetical protein PRIEUP_LOCUS77 [Pristimantis euphronides]